MQLVESVSIPQSIEKRSLVLDADTLRRRRKLMGDRAYVLFAIEMSYPGQKNPSIHIESFCEDWKITESELDVALAAIQKKGYLHRPASVVQLELFSDPPEDEQ